MTKTFRYLSPFLLFLLLFLAGYSQADQKSLDEYWKEVELDISLLDRTLSNENCQSDARSFIGCVQALNRLFARDEENTIFVPSDSLASFDIPLTPIPSADFGDLMLVSFPEFNSTSLVDNAIKATKFRNDLNTRLEDLFLSPDKSVDFPYILAWFKTKLLDRKKDDIQKITAEAYNSFLSVAEDPHTYILPSRYFSDRMRSNSDNYGGIGAWIKKRDEVVLIKPWKGSPAMKAGLLPGDIITHVDETDIKAMPLTDVIKLIKGPQGTKVAFRIIRKNKTLGSPIVVVRERIDLKNVTHKVLEDKNHEHRVGYIKLRSFGSEDTCRDVRQALEALEAQSVSGLILDMRDNGGGLLDEAVCVSSLFLPPNSPVVSIKDISSGFETTYSKDSPLLFDLPLITLINSGTASASEIVSGALQDHRRGFVVGDRSFGKGTVQSGRHFSKGVLLYQTDQRFYLPSGRSNQLEGIIPDLQVFTKPEPDKDDMFAIREEDAYIYALPHIGDKFVQPRPDLVNALSRCVNATGAAKRLARDEFLDDYQLLYAQDAMACILEREESPPSFFTGLKQAPGFGSRMD